MFLYNVMIGYKLLRG